MQTFVPKSRRPRFELGLKIIDIINVPLSNGIAYVRWRLPSSSATEHQGYTEKVDVIDHRAAWNYEKSLHVRLTIDRTSTLQECELYFEVIQEFGSTANAEKSMLGKIKLNLAEYVDKIEHDEGVVRRYLMHDSKVNSTVKIGIATRQIEGDRNFITPPLKSATVFGGIAGVVQSSEPVDSDELKQLPSINVKSREITDMQDMYRRTLAASWTSRAGDMPADKFVEEIFAGSSCWTSELQRASSGGLPEGNYRESFLGGDAGTRQSRTGKMLAPGFDRRTSNSRSRSGGKTPDSLSALGHEQNGGSIEDQLYDGAKGRGWKGRDADAELSEFEVREDLRSWEVAAKE